ncbi:MAG TPA: YdeI/OmpD-associated family protein [Polyangiaceae bacterium]|nr:YdeI/OmpD-associated family protein [Polyangiaceae bacterium]
MPAIVPNPKKIKSFPTEAAFEQWLAKHHARETELWLKLHKKGSGLASVTNSEAVDVALCWGWIDGVRLPFDERSFLQRFSPRKGRSVWSKLNRDRVARLTKAGRMTEHGQKHVDAAKADKRWDAAYAPMRTMTPESLPADLLKAIDANARAKKRLATLARLDLFALAFRTNNMKTAEGRSKKIAELVGKLARGEPIAQQRKPAKSR